MNLTAELEDLILDIGLIHLSQPTGLRPSPTPRCKWFDQIWWPTCFSEKFSAKNLESQVASRTADPGEVVYQSHLIHNNLQSKNLIYCQYMSCMSICVYLYVASCSSGLQMISFD